MKILIITDSRGFCPDRNKIHPDKPRHFNWVDRFVQRNHQHNIDAQNWKGNVRLASIFDQVDYIKRNGAKYDLIISQSGYFEYANPWPKSIFVSKLKGRDPKLNENLTQVDTNMFMYKNDKLIDSMLDQVKAATNHFLFIEMHGIGKNIGQVLEMNNLYGKFEFLALAGHPYWYPIYCYDSVHYSDLGAEFVCSYVERYIKRINTSINSRLYENCINK